jgi:sensor domain CHASE-containing protein
MIDDTSVISWSTIKDILSSVGVLIAIIVSIVGLVKSSRQKEIDQINSLKEDINNIKEKLTEHILDDEHAITELQTKVEYLTDNINTKLDVIVHELDKD